MTCGCKHKVIYGFSMMLSGESPEMLFDLVMTRFEPGYNPHIIYDASCRVKEYGLSRDSFHEVNHTSCSEAFKSSLYDSLKNVNTETAEQTNHLLRSISTSTTFMSPQLYLRSIKLFMAHQNIVANMKKIKVTSSSYKFSSINVGGIQSILSSRYTQTNKCMYVCMYVCMYLVSSIGQLIRHML